MCRRSPACKTGRAWKIGAQDWGCRTKNGSEREDRRFHRGRRLQGVTATEEDGLEDWRCVSHRHHLPDRRNCVTFLLGMKLCDGFWVSLADECKVMDTRTPFPLLLSWTPFFFCARNGLYTAFISTIELALIPF